MTKNLIELKQSLSRVKPWVAVAAVLTVALLSYYTFLGARYWKASQQAPALDARVQQLLRVTRQELPEEVIAQTELESAEERLKALRQLFIYPQTDDLLGIVAATAKDARVGLLSMTAGEQQTRTIDGITYQVQPITVSLLGEAGSVFKFISLMHQKVPVLSVARFGVASLDSTPSTNVQMQVLLSPEAAEVKETK